MSLHHPNLWNVVNKQWKYKWISYKSVFQGLIIVQIIAIVFSLLGVGNGGFGSGAFHLNVQYVSGDIVFFLYVYLGFLLRLQLIVWITG
ncbi:hypothetical protein [Piscibacillus salipiscarius]|uniref:hypothetical protein n=1 Tax=Piscibacillus salipiscarius TaxID=299480 RepID=UPI0024366CE8|nr:hypothetical protein [Piscibacillus salipiscarius]